MHHRIEPLLPTVKSQICTEVTNVLAFYAKNGKHGPILMKELFLKVADELVKAEIFERPLHLRGSKFIRHLNGNQAQLFPNYGIPDDIATFIRQYFWELFLQGILAPATKLTPNRTYLYDWVSFDEVFFTPYGVSILVDPQKKIQVHDPDGYLSNFLESSPLPDEEMMTYLRESIAVFRGHHLMASVVLLGIASERLVDVLAESLRDATNDDNWFNEKYKNKKISQKFKSLEGKLMGNYGPELAAMDIKDAFQQVVKLTFEQIRIARNGIAHPNGSDFTWNEVSGFLHNFVQYFKYINQIIAFLNDQKK